VLAVEKRVTSPLLDPSSIEKIMELDTHIGCAMSGLTADARTLVDKARVETQNHRFTYDEPMTVESCTQAICDYALQFGEEGAPMYFFFIFFLFLGTVCWQLTMVLYNTNLYYKDLE
jgi:20S proteasome alpha/beta subunit